MLRMRLRRDSCAHEQNTLANAAVDALAYARAHALANTAVDALAYARAHALADTAVDGDANAHANDRCAGRCAVGCALP
jgi:hypothetical protein